LSANGTAADSAAFETLAADLAQQIPKSVALGPINVLPPRAARFVWSVNVDAASATLAGNVPSQAVKDAVTATVRATFPGLPLVDGDTIASGDPPGFADAATFVVRELRH